MKQQGVLGRRAAWQETMRALRRTGPVPKHVAIIMDGNGRWARQRGLPRVAGHRAGVQAVRGVVEGAVDLGIEALTLYGFSTENWKRPREEVDALISLLIDFAEREIEALDQIRVRVKAIGHIEDLPGPAAAAVRRAVERSQHQDGLELVLALNYGGRQELVDAARRLGDDLVAGRLRLDEINADQFARRLDTAGLPDPDLIIRTSGEQRISNFLLWQIAYAELWTTDTYWPDFRREDLAAAVADYQRRERRFGSLAARRPPAEDSGGPPLC
ncbi:MAG: isoprenyl transferase [Thermaerobacterales bacterium]